VRAGTGVVVDNLLLYVTGGVASRTSSAAIRRSIFNTPELTCGPPGQVNRFDHHDLVWIGKIGLNYRFGGPAVVAKH
jgi:hypothetical protein